MTTTVEVLTRARGHVAEGWIQGDLFGYADGKQVTEYPAPLDTPPVSCCSIGGIRWAADELETSAHHARETLRESIRWFEGLSTEQFVSIADWNDTEGRTQAEVLAVFDIAIEKARETGE